MKFAIVPSIRVVWVALCAAALLESIPTLRASEPSSDCQSAVDALVAGFEVHHDQALVLFEDALQTNPACRRQLFLTAVELMGEERGMLASLIHVARAAFPDEDSLFAEAAMSFAPERSEEIRAAFLSSPQEMDTSKPAGNSAVTALPSPADHARADEEIREAIARMAAKAAGKPWPEQTLSDEPLRFKKHDEVRIPRASRGADESSLVNSLPIDRHDERAIAPQPVRIDDGWTRDGRVRLDESKFSGTPDGNGAEGAATAPLSAKVREMAPAGAVGLPKRPPLPRSSVYYIPPAAESYESTIDLESDESPRPPLIIRPDPISPTLPARVR